MVKEPRWRSAPEHPRQSYLSARGREEILATDHEIDALFDVVDDDGELIGPVSTAVAREEVAALVVRVLRHGPKAKIVEVLGEAGCHENAACRRDVRIDLACAAGAGISEFRGVRRTRRCACDIDPRTAAGVGQTARVQLREASLVARGVVTLSLARLTGAESGGAHAIWHQSQPVEIVEERLFVLGPTAAPIMIFHPQEHAAAEGSCDPPDPDGVRGMAQVQIARRRWGEPRGEAWWRERNGEGVRGTHGGSRGEVAISPRTAGLTTCLPQDRLQQAGELASVLCPSFILASVPSTDSSVTLVEVSPRDGLQNERQLLPASVKVGLVDRLSGAGFRAIEVTAFVSPTAVPQMADAADVMAQITRHAGVRYSVLTPNMRGLEGALAARADAICVFGAASESFSQRNINCSIAESLERFRPVVAAARAQGLVVRGTVSCALGCPYEGDVTPTAVARVAGELLAMGCDELSIADTIGVGTPESTRRVMESVLGIADVSRVNGHFHDTYGRALVNIDTCLDLGIRSFDSSVAGLGGCPFAPGATGNVATELILERLAARGFETGVDLAIVRDTGVWVRAQLLGR